MNNLIRRYLFIVLAYGASSGVSFSQCVTGNVSIINATPSTVSNEVALNWNGVTPRSGSFVINVVINYTVEYGIGNFNSAVSAGGATAVTIGNLSFGSSYVFRVRVTTSCQDAQDTQTQYFDNFLSTVTRSATIIPAVPGLAAGTPASANSINISWNAVTGATSYDYEVSNSTNVVVASGNIAGTSAIINGLNANTNYFYRVRARNATGPSAFSAKSGAILTHPDAPTFPTSAALAITTTSFKATWNAVAGAESYRLEVSTDPNFGTFVTNPSPLVLTATTSPDITGLTGATTYYFRVRAVNNLGGTSANSVRSQTLTAPNVPTGFTANASSPTSITANWATTLTATQYELVIATDANFNSPIAGYNPKIINAPLLTDNITNLSPSTTYHLKLRAKNGTNSYSDYTFPISATTPVAALPPPTFPTASATAITSSSFQINWNGVSGAASYQVDVSADPNFTSFVINNQAVTITSAPVNSLSGGTTYYYRIRAVNGVGVASANSVTSQVVTAPVVPTGFAVSSETSSSMSVNWVAVSAAVQYELMVATDQGFNFPIAGYNPKTVIAPALADNITGLSATTTYYLKLRAKGETGLFSDFTFTSAATIAVGGGNTSIKLNNVVFDPVHIMGSAQELTVDVSGSTGSVSVTLYHRKNSEDVFSQEPVQPQTGKYKIAVSDTWFDSFGMEFYFKAQDQSSQATSTVSKITAGVSSVAIPLTSFGPDAKNYQVVSFPYNFQDRSLVQDVFEQVMGSYNKKKWRLFQYRDGVNIEYTEGISASTIEQGKAYWFVSKNEVGLTLGQGKSFGNSLTSPFKLQLKKGWNQIGNPFPYNLSWQEVLSTNSNPAGVSNLIVFDNTSISFIESDLLAVFGGGFVFADEPIELVFPVTLKAKANGRVASKSFLPELKDPQDWYLPIGLKQGEVTSTMGGIGMLKDAKEGKDRYDRNSPPNFIRFVEFNSSIKDYPAELTRNISSHQNQKVWNYEVNSNSNEPVELKWNGELVKSLEGQLILFDETTQHVVNMADTDSHLTASTSKISIHYTHEPPSLEVNSIALGEAYPNPFVQDVTIPFGFSIGEPSEATLRIIDLNGSILMKKEVLKSEDGIKSVQWNGQSDEGIEVKSGMYIYQVFGSRTDGKSFRFTGKIIKQ